MNDNNEDNKTKEIMLSTPNYKISRLLIYEHSVKNMRIINKSISLYLNKPT